VSSPDINQRPKKGDYMSNIPSQTANVHKNEVHLAGVLTRDPLIKYTPSGKPVANFTLATTYKQYTEYTRCAAWEQLAEILADKHKGDFIKLVGRLQTRNWDDKQSGQKRYTTEVVAFTLSTEEPEPPLTPDPNRKSGTNAARAILAPGDKNIHGVAITNDDIPF
jgi:single-strand DNA-binding protein